MRTSEDGKSQYAEVENAGKTVYVEHVTTINGVKKYVATLTLRKNEDGKNQAQQSAIETVRILAAANTILMNDTFSVIRPGNIPFIAKNNPNRMTKEQAQQMIDEVLSLYCCGPAAGGGARAYVTAQSSTASILVNRQLVDPNIKIRIL